MDVDTDSTDKLTLQRIAGGSVIKRPPVFSADGEMLFVVWDNVVRAYSSQTGEWIRDLEGAPDEIVNVQHSPANARCLFACTRSGQLLSWKVKSGVLDQRQQLQLPDAVPLAVLAFRFVDAADGRLSALLVWRTGPSTTRIGIVDAVTGQPSADTPDYPFSLLPGVPFDLDVSNARNYFAVVQAHRLHVHSLRGPAVHRSWTSAQKRRLTCVRVHPLDEQLATGDELGRIFVWRDLFTGAPAAPHTRLYHWHHTAVNALCFSETGTALYSGGNESVLVRWNLAQADSKSFLPRCSGCPVHLAVSPENRKIALATDDNGIQLLNGQFRPLAIVQNFTWVADDKTLSERFPVGLRVNPRNSALMLNGRVGHLQFFSTHTRSLLYNLDTTAQNRLSLETSKVLYNTEIVRSAISMDWLATVERLDDQQTAVELRLKFWHYDTAKQTFELNTQVELPHEGGSVEALEFSSASDGEGLMCASAGADNVLKVWTLEASDNVNKKGKFWACTGKTNYKNLPIRSLAFSADASLLAVGFGNALCVYQAETLRLRAVLSCPAGLDGSANKITLNLADAAADTVGKSKRATVQKQQLLERRRKMLQAVRAYLANDADSDLWRTVQRKLTALAASPQRVHAAQLSGRERELLHARIMSLNELNFFQKLELFGDLRLRSQAPEHVRAKLNAYVGRRVDRAGRVARTLRARIAAVPERSRYELARKLFNYGKRSKRSLAANRRVRKLIGNGSATVAPKTNGQQEKRAKAQPDVEQVDRLPVKSAAQIRQVHFGTGDYAHLVIVCTERRLLIWNMLTLRLQTALKLSVHRLTVDPFTSLVAAFTVHNELYVFLPDVHTLYQRKNLPPIHGAVWIPRRYRKSSALDLDWQATSQLFFLSTTQEIYQLASESDRQTLTSSAAYLQQDGPAPVAHTAFGAMLAKQITNATAGQSAGGDRLPPSALGRNSSGKTTVKQVISLPTHTMSSIHLLCSSVLKSLAVAADGSRTIGDRLSGQPLNGHSAGQFNGNDDAEDDEDDDLDADGEAQRQKLANRQQRLRQAEQLVRAQKSQLNAEAGFNDREAAEKHLQKLAKRSLAI